MNISDKGLDFIRSFEGYAKELKDGSGRCTAYQEKLRGGYDIPTIGYGCTEGVKDGMIRVGDFGPKVPKKVQDEIVAKQKAVGAGKLFPFAGPIMDNEGNVVLPAGQILSDAQILGMNYLVQGVVGKISR